MMDFFKRFTRPKATLSLGVHKNQLSFGDELKGIVNLKSQEEFEAEEIRVSLHCVETVKKTKRYQELVEVGTEEDGEPIRKPVWREKEYEDSETLYSDHLRLCGLMPVVVGLNLDFPFVFKLPLIGRETYHSVDKNVRWSVGAYMKIRKRRGIYSHGSGEILIAKPTVSNLPTKEVIREVVLIPCKYCGGLMPQTAIFCPNCGARRTA